MKTDEISSWISHEILGADIIFECGIKPCRRFKIQSDNLIDVFPELINPGQIIYVKFLYHGSEIKIESNDNILVKGKHIVKQFKGKFF